MRIRAPASRCFTPETDRDLEERLIARRLKEARARFRAVARHDLPRRSGCRVRATQGHHHPGETRRSPREIPTRANQSYQSSSAAPRASVERQSTARSTGVPRQVRVRLQQNHARRQGGRAGGRALRVRRQGVVRVGHRRQPLWNTPRSAASSSGRPSRRFRRRTTRTRSPSSSWTSRA